MTAKINRLTTKAVALLCSLAILLQPTVAASAAFNFPPPDDLNIRIIGTASFQGRQTALIEDVNTRSDVFYRVGDPIYGYKIIEITREGVVIEKFGKQYAVAFQESALIARQQERAGTDTVASAYLPAQPQNSVTGPTSYLTAAMIPLKQSDVAPNFYVDGPKGTQWDLWSSPAKGIANKAAELGGRFVMPIARFKRMSSRFGYRKHPISGGRKMHKGIDLSAAKGTKIFAADSGTVTFSGYRGGYGYCIQIDHHNGYSTLYGHCSKLISDVGDNVRRGDYIAQVGSTGASTGPHLHFEVRQKGTAIDPAQFFKGRL